MPRKWTLKYGLAAVLVAIAVITVALVANPMSPLFPAQTSAGASFAVMLADPPTIDFSGTTVLNMTYSNVSLHVTYLNGTTEWLNVSASGTVDLFSLWQANSSQTIASTTIPNNSTVDKIQFTIVSVEAEINGTTYPVTTLSNTLVTSIANGQVNQTLSGVLLDFNPTLLQIQATDANGNLVYYYVMVPSATATIVTSLTREQVKVGTIVSLGQNLREKITRVVQEFPNNITIVSASLSVNGNDTTLSVTLMNQGDVTFKILGLTVHGEFNATWTRTTEGRMGQMISQVIVERIGAGTLAFKVNDSSLIPLFAADQDEAVEMSPMEISPLILQPGQSATLSFSGIIALQPNIGVMKVPVIVVTPIVGDNYTLRLVGEGLETISVTATS